MRLLGRIYARGSILRVADAQISATAGATTLRAQSDAKGEFELVLPIAAEAPAEAAIVIRAPGFEPLRASFALKPGRLGAEYLLRKRKTTQPFTSVVRGDVPAEGVVVTRAIGAGELVPVDAVGEVDGERLAPLVLVLACRGESAGVEHDAERILQRRAVGIAHQRDDAGGVQRLGGGRFGACGAQCAHIAGQGAVHRRWFRAGRDRGVSAGRQRPAPWRSRCA